MITGIDLSHWQGIVDWDKINANPDIGFVIMKGTEADGYTDPNLGRNWSLCEKPKAVYHFWRYAIDGAEQAQYFFDEVSAVIESEKMRPVFDYEDTAAPKLTNAPSALKEFHEAAQARWYGRTPLVYTGAWWWDEWIKKDVCSSNPLWAAHYPKWFSDGSGGWRVATNFAEMLGYLAVHPTVGPYLPKTGGWSAWKMWQFTSSGKIDGIAGNVDLNLYNGDAQDLAAFFYADAQNPPPPPPVGDWDEARVAEIEARLDALEAQQNKVRQAWIP